MKKNHEDQSLHFEISSALKSVIGQDLITNDFVAIFELVKNSFDANAKNVDIIFEDDNGVMDKIFIIDDGKGMSYEDLVNKWLFVAYSAKKDGSEDNNVNKIYAGNKGVGRFSCDRVGGTLRLQSKSVSDRNVNILDVDWGAFEVDAKTKFENVAVKHHVTSEFELPDNIAHNQQSGVVLEISALREPISWDRSKLKRLRSSLAKLINPFGSSVSPIKLNIFCQREVSQDEVLNIKYNNQASSTCDDIVDPPILVNGPVTNDIFSVLKDKTTSLNVELDNNGHFVTTLIDRGELIYQVRESTSQYNLLADSDFSCQIFSLNQSAKSLFKRRTGIHSVAFGSLFLFRNGFRVMPIGDESDDSWGIDRRHQQGYSRTLGTRDIMGRVDIAGPETKFKETSSRDGGLVETAASIQLFDYVFTKCVRRLEQYVVGVTWQDSIDKHHDTSQRLSLDENRANIIDLVTKLAGSKELELIDYSRDLIDVLSEKSSYFERSVEKLAKLAESSSDDGLMWNISQARKRFAELKKSEEEAREIASRELKARIEAEKQAKVEMKLRAEAERKAEEESKLKLEAEKKANRESDLKEKARVEAEKFNLAYEEEKKRNLFLLSNENKDIEQLESFLHQIVIYTSSAKQKITSTLLKINNSQDEIHRDELINSLSDLLESVEKIMTTSRFATSANFKLDSTKITDDVSVYVKDYLEKISTAYNSRIQIKVESDNKKFITTFTPIELGMVLDNIVSNSKKARASLITFDIKRESNNVLNIVAIDNGKGLDKSIFEKERVFEKGITTTRGSGLGLFHCKKQIEKMGGEISVSEKQPNQGFSIRIRLRK
ncbi:ATP-binding protein [Serratia rubidaea]|uniref:ATP-binding protein n=1 Tax=Serratia rubidaea TaxID=61652 RepID=UPI0023AF903A|nr:ATP-binding protein [Serratia rubidaea]MDK1706493.1 ATP-binding protein [Serratia rubidaea]